MSIRVPRHIVPPDRARIGAAVRSLRRERAWTQAELAKELGLSQSRLSEIETGAGSFTAEQFLLILKLFNVPAGRFTDDAPDRSSQLQNALARLGAHHLQESEDVLPGDDLDDPIRTVEEALCEGDPRLTTALAPVLVANVDRVRLAKIHQDLSRVGFERRLAWVCENTVQAIELELKNEVPLDWATAARRAAVVIGQFVDAVTRARRSSGSASLEAIESDILDPSIRSDKTLKEVRKRESAISRKWRVDTALAPEDFAEALRAARAAHA